MFYTIFVMHHSNSLVPSALCYINCLSCMFVNYSLSIIGASSSGSLSGRLQWMSFLKNIVRKNYQTLLNSIRPKL